MNGNLVITIQPELIFSLVIMLAIIIFSIVAGKKIAVADPTQPPKGIVVVCETLVNALYNFFKSILPANFEPWVYPYFAVLAIYILISNLSGLIGFDAPTSNFSITFAMALVTFAMIQVTAFKKKGAFKYVKELVFPPTNILSAAAPLISLSMRLFGNILSGSIIMALLYSLLGWVSGLIIPFNFLGPVVAPVLHAYFDVFASLIQTFIFVTLSSVYIALEYEG